MWEPQTSKTLKACNMKAEILGSAMKINMQYIKLNRVVLYMPRSVRDKEQQNVSTLHMNNIKYAAPVEMQNPLKS